MEFYLDKVAMGVGEGILLDKVPVFVHAGMARYISIYKLKLIKDLGV